MQRAHAQAHAARRWRLAGSAGGGAAPEVPAAPPFVFAAAAAAFSPAFPEAAGLGTGLGTAAATFFAAFSVLDVIHVSSVYHDVYHSLGRDTLLIHCNTCITL